MLRVIGVRRDRYEQALTLSPLRLPHTKRIWQSHILYCVTKSWPDEYPDMGLCLPYLKDHRMVYKHTHTVIIAMIL